MQVPLLRKITEQGFLESHVHDVTITREAPTRLESVLAGYAP